MTLAKRFAGFLTFAIGIALSANALATTTTYTDEGDFLAVAGPVDLESFEGLNATNSFTADTIVLPDFTVTGTGQFTPTLGVWNEPFVGGFATDGTNWLGYQSDANEMLIFDLNQPVNAFGLNITDWGDFGTGTLTFSNDLGEQFVVDVTPNPNGDLQFFGVINDSMAFNTVTFTQTIAGEFYGVDEIYYGQLGTTPVEVVSWGSIKGDFAN